MILGDDAESHPAPHAITAAIATTGGSVAPLQHADASFASDAPFLSLLGPAFLFQSGVAPRSVCSGSQILSSKASKPKKSDLSVPHIFRTFEASKGSDL